MDEPTRLNLQTDALAQRIVKRFRQLMMDQVIELVANYKYEDEPIRFGKHKGQPKRLDRPAIPTF